MTLYRILGFALAVSLACPSLAQPYPGKPIRFIVPFAAGGSIDGGARLVANFLAKRVGQATIVENRPGADGVIGTDAVIKAAPDGYTVLAVGGTSFNPALIKNLPFDIFKDLAPVTLFRVGDTAIMVNPAFPAQNLKELVAWAKANPGKLNFGGSTAPTTLATEMFKKTLGIDGTVVPYKGSAPVLTALMAGEVQIALDPPGAYKGAIDGGRVRVIAINGPRRMAAFPNAVSTTEQGVKFDYATNTGYWVPAATPRAIIDILNRELHAVFKDPEVVRFVGEAGGVVEATTPEGFRDYIRKDQEFLAEGARLIKYQPQ